MAVADHIPVVRVAVHERVAAPRLLVSDILRLGNVDEDVEVIRYDRIRKNDHAAPRLVAPPGCCAGGYELLDPAQQLNRPRLLLIIQKEGPVHTTHSASLREQPSGWWI